MNPLDIDKVARLAQLKLTDAEKVEFSGQLKSILAHVESLASVDTSFVDPGRSSSSRIESTPLRDDDSAETTRVESSGNLVEAAGGHVQDLFEVPQVVG